MNTIFDIEITEDDLLNKKYNFQPELTPSLDLLNSNFDQGTINQIVLWKVNRYSQVSENTLTLLNKINKENKVLNRELTEDILFSLLATKGIQLPMASTILRFKNPSIYQIIDQRVYRFITGENLPAYFSNCEKQVNLYLDYLDRLKEVCQIKKINFELSDRIIYELDKKHNKENPIRY